MRTVCIMACSPSGPPTGPTRSVYVFKHTPSERLLSDITSWITKLVGLDGFRLFGWTGSMVLLWRDTSKSSVWYALMSTPLTLQLVWKYVLVPGDGQEISPAF